ncbi:MAG: polynucleotide kinase-phosphatase [Thermodesulfobacteriota bacterium]
MKVTIPELSLVVLVGPSGCGKSTFAQRHFKPTEVLSSDYCRGLVADDENDQSATRDAFDVLHFIAGKRLAARRLTVIDATSVKPEDRKPLVALAREFHVLSVAIVFNLPPKLCHERNENRPDRSFGSHVIRQQSQALRRHLRGLKHEGFRHITVLSSPEEVESVTIERQPLWTDRRADHGPFDIIGDVHGCFDELVELLGALGYEIDARAETPRARHPAARKAVLLGDLVDRGPNSPAVLRLAMSMVEDGTAFCLPGNHDDKLRRKLLGREVRITHGLGETLAQLDHEPPEFKERVATFLDGLVSHYVLDKGKLVVAHAGLKEELQGRASAVVREFALFGETTGETDEFGLPVRYNWAGDYRGKATVVYGHTPVPEVAWTNRTICIDTGCVFGGKLTALRYPEKELVQVPARKTYYEPARPLHPSDADQPPVAERPYHDLLDINDVVGKRIIQTGVHRNVTIREENAAAALEVMSRFAADPHWLIYLPPTMSPSDTCKDGEYLEYPRETFAYFRHQGVAKVVCQEKHMGSRAVIVLCKDEATARRRFGVTDSGVGFVYTRTGRPFFSDIDQHAEVLDRLRAAMDRTGMWGRFETDWICLDAEIMPWSAKAQELLRSQYAPTGASATFALDAAVTALAKASERSDGNKQLASRFLSRQSCIARYVEAYRRYCWKVDSVSDLTIAPFHLLATERRVHVDMDHVRQMEVLGELCRGDEELLRATRFHVIDVTDTERERQGTEWWEELTERGGEGMVVKPANWIVKGRRGLVQPALKCRGREYLRIIYGPEYTLPEQMDRLRERGLSVKRSLALREFALGIEALERLVRGEPLYRVHECVFGVLALESEPVDPRL